ncbi:MAG TPA: hypothetical protein VK604_21035 [Bryobacteraceae bacterium]|nr:hypothetical protein [Bryobacteraceae bacterium]
MKLRFRGNTLRLRVNQREVMALAEGNALQEQIIFPGENGLSYVLETCAEPAGKASFQQGTIRVSAPSKQVRDWADSSTNVGIYFDLAANGSVLKVAIEKDLECVDGPEDERDPEAFPRELKSC